MEFMFAVFCLEGGYLALSNLQEKSEKTSQVI